MDGKNEEGRGKGFKGATVRWEGWRVINGWKE